MKQAIQNGLAQLPGELANTNADLLCLYGQRMLEKNQVMNLTAITDEEQVAYLHFLDSIALATITDLAGKSLIDVGSGAGFPGLPLKIAVPSMELTLLDSLGKRTLWLEELCQELGVEANIVNARAEEAGATTEYRQCFDVATARGVAQLNVLCELCLPFVKVGGLFIAMKSTDCDQELEAAQNAIKTLGSKVERVVDYTVPGYDVIHRAVLIRKTRKTSDVYPRRFARIKKEPL